MVLLKKWFWDGTKIEQNIINIGEIVDIIMETANDTNVEIGRKFKHYI